MTAAVDPLAIGVFVHLARGFGARSWEARWRNGTSVGINDRLPYGYFWAVEDGCDVHYSEDWPEGRIAKVVRLGVRAVLGFDFIHAWRNRAAIWSADVVWTHTESQHLAILLLFRISRREHRPKLIAQSVWLFDRWPTFWPLKRRFFAALLAQADLLTVHSPDNLKRTRDLFPHTRSELVLYGIRTSIPALRREREVHQPIRVLSLGNDKDRDWPTLIGAVSGSDGCELRIVSRRLRPRDVARARSVELTRPKSTDDLFALYEWADFVVLAMRPNLHASGITVIQEAAVCGVPVICSDVGGLRAYFADDTVRYVPPGDPQAMRQAIDALAADDEGRWQMAQRAKARMGPHGLSAQSYARRHAELSKELLARDSTA